MDIFKTLLLNNVPAQGGGGGSVISVAGKTGVVTLVPSDVGLGNVTDDTQTKAAIVPNTAPTSGQVLVGNAGGTAYAPASVSGDGSLSSAGALTVTKTNGTSFAASATTDTTNAANITSGTLPNARLVAVPNSSLANSAITIAGSSTSLGGSISQDTITGLSTTGLVKRTGVNTLATATSGTDYAPATSGSSILYGDGSGGFSNATVGSGLSFSTGTLAASVTSVAGKTGAVTLSSSDVGLGNVTNNTQTQAAIVPNTVPSAGQLLVGNAGGTAYAPVSTSGDVTIASTGATTIGSGKVTNAMLAGSIDLTTKVTGALPIANGGTGATTQSGAANAVLPSQSTNSGKFLTTDGSNVSWATVSGGGGSVSWGGITGTLSNQTDLQSALDGKAPTTSGTSILYGNGSGGFSNVTVSTGLTFSTGTLTAAVSSVAGKTGAVTLASSDVGLGNVTNDAQTKAAIVPNTAPAAGQLLVGNAGGTAYAPVSASGDATISSTGAITVTKTSGTSFAASATTDTTNATNITSGTLSNDRLSAVPNSALANSAITIAGTSTSLGGSISQDTITGLSTTGLVKRTGTNTLAVATAGTDYLTPTGSGASLTGITATQVGLGNVTNDTQTKAAIVPNTAPSAGQILVGNAGGTAYAPVSSSGDVTVASTGAFTIGASKVTNAMLAGSIDLTTKVTGTLPIANGGTGATTAATAATALGLGTGNNVTHNSVSDVSGNVRSIPQNAKTSSYTLVIGDLGKHISTNSNVTVPASVFSAGDVISVYNNTSGTIAIVQGTSVTLRYSGSTSTGNRSLTSYGVCTILCVASNTFVISGAGLS